MFNPRAYGDEVAEILALDGNGEREMPLVHRACVSGDARARIKAAKIAPLLRAGLYLYFDCWEEAHEVAQDIETREGSYWHAIVHRQEPDAGNAAYWFRQVGAHPIFREMRLPNGGSWDPIAFVELCGRGHADAAALQLREWQLLFGYCAGV